MFQIINYNVFWVFFPYWAKSIDIKLSWCIIQGLSDQWFKIIYAFTSVDKSGVICIYVAHLWYNDQWQFIYVLNRKRRGPRTEPCGTAHLREHLPRVTIIQITFFWFLRYKLINLNGASWHRTTIAFQLECWYLHNNAQVTERGLKIEFILKSFKSLLNQWFYNGPNCPL